MTDSAEKKLGKKSGWFARLRQGLSKSTTKLSDGIGGLFTKAKLDSATLDELEDLLITADLGVATATRITDKLAASRYDKEISAAEVRGVMADTIAEALAPYRRDLDFGAQHRPHVVLMVGVNGAGKTTTIGKLANKLMGQGKKVMLAAGDTFRAAAIEQLAVWGDRAGVPVVTSKVGGDAAGLAFDAYKRAQAENIDVLLIDTAGRLQNKQGLMAELSKIRRVLAKQNPDAPHDVVLVLDATTGQNALNQIEVFKDVAGVSALVMTKLDGTARGGVLVAAVEKFHLPVLAIGVGEQIEDFQAFDPSAYAKALVGIAD